MRVRQRSDRPHDPERPLRPDPPRGLPPARLPVLPEEAVAAAWLAVGKEHAVVSHESALELLGLGDVIADRIHLTVPRAQRYVRPPAGTILHTTTPPLAD